MNESVFTFLTYYASCPDPQYAVMLSGDWGCGKTHFVKAWLDKFEQESKHAADENSIELKPIYISLFGMSTIQDIKKAIDRCVNPFFYSKTGKVLKTVFRLASKIAFKTELDLNEDGKNETSFSGTLDSLSIFESDNDEVTGIKFIVFDDLERTQIPMKQLLGFINYFIEHCNCRVVLVGEEKRMKEEARADLMEFKEKVVGREFKIKPDIKTAISEFLEQPEMYKEFLCTEIETIETCFMCTQTNNLRLLRQSLLDYSFLLLKLSETDVLKHNISYFRALLCTFIAVYAEYRNVDNHELFSHWKDNYTQVFLTREGEERSKVLGIISKYAPLNSQNMFEVLNPSLVPMIVYSLETGESMDKQILDIFAKQKNNINVLPRFESYYDLSNEEFEAVYATLFKELQDNSISSPYEIGKAIAFIGCFDKDNIKELSADALNQLIEFSMRPLHECSSLLDIYKCNTQFMQGYQYVRNSAREHFKTEEVVASFSKEVEKLKTFYPDEMQSLLRKLSDENVGQLFEVDQSSYPDHSSTYKLRAIFEHENPELLFESICQMSNKGRNTFSRFLSRHFEFSVNCSYSHIYKPDGSILVELKNKVVEKIAQVSGIDRLSYTYLFEALEKSIKRCEGAECID